MDIQILSYHYNKPVVHGQLNGLNGRFGRWLKGILGRVASAAIAMGDALTGGLVSASGAASWLMGQISSIPTESPISVINKIGESFEYDDELPMTADETQILERWLSEKFTPFYANLMALATSLTPDKIGDANSILRKAASIKGYNLAVKGNSTAQLSMNAIINRGTATNYLMDRVITLVNDKMEGQIQQQIEFSLKSENLMSLGFDTSLLTNTVRFKGYGDRFAVTDPFTAISDPTTGGVKDNPGQGTLITTNPTDPGNTTGTIITPDEKKKGGLVLFGFGLAVLTAFLLKRRD